MILTDKEREYLKEVIRPFRNEVYNVAKIHDGVNNLYIDVELVHDCILLPCFSEDSTMYKGMKTGQRYTLKELGIAYD